MMLNSASQPSPTHGPLFFLKINRLFQRLLFSCMVDGMHAGQIQGGWRHTRRCRSILGMRGETLLTPVQTAVQVRRSG